MSVVAGQASSCPMAAAPMFLCMSTMSKAAGMKTLVRANWSHTKSAPRGMAAQRPSSFACLTRRMPSLPSPARGKSGHRGLARPNPCLIPLHLAFEAPNVRLAAPCQTAPCRKVMGVPGHRSQAARKVK